MYCILTFFGLVLSLVACLCVGFSVLGGLCTLPAVILSSIALCCVRGASTREAARRTLFAKVALPFFLFTQYIPLSSVSKVGNIHGIVLFKYLISLYADMSKCFVHVLLYRIFDFIDIADRNGPRDLCIAGRRAIGDCLLRDDQGTRTRIGTSSFSHYSSPRR